MLRRTLIFTFGAALWSFAPAALADPVAAEALFREARALLEAGEIDAACEKFEASSAIEPSSGTLLNLAACRLRQGRTATAWAYFAAAARSARAQNRPAHEAEAEQRAREVEASLSYLTIRVTGNEPGLRILRNGRELEPASVGSKLPTDPGPIVIEASAPGYEGLRLELTLGEARDERVVTLPALRRPIEKAPTAAAVLPRARDAAPASSALPWVVGGVGAAALLTGGLFGVLALSSNAEAERECDQRTTECPTAALSAQDRGDTQATIATIGVGAGLVGIGVAAVLLVTAPSADAAPDRPWRAGADVARDRLLVHASATF